MHKMIIRSPKYSSIHKKKAFKLQPNIWEMAFTILYDLLIRRNASQVN